MPSAVRRKRPKIGDIVEIQTPRGLAYAQLTYNHVDPPKYGHLIRVLPGLYANRPASLSDMAQGKERFYTFFPLGAACSRGIVEIVANEPVPIHSQGLPLMRMAGGMSSDGKVLNWWLWDGEEERMIGGIDEFSKYLSIVQIMNDKMLIDRITSGWLPEDDG